MNEDRLLRAYRDLDKGHPPPYLAARSAARAREALPRARRRGETFRLCLVWALVAAACAWVLVGVGWPDWAGRAMVLLSPLAFWAALMPEGLARVTAPVRVLLSCPPGSSPTRDG